MVSAFQPDFFTSDPALCNMLLYPSNPLPGLLTPERCFQLFEHANNGIWIFNKNDIVTYVNETMARMLGYSAPEMLGKALSEFMATSERLDDSVMHHVFKTSESQELKLLHQNGQTVWAMVNRIPLQDAQGRYEGTIAQVVNNTAQKEIEQDLRKAVERETLLRRLSEMISQTFDLEEILIHSAREIGEYLQADRCLVIRYDKEANYGKLSSQFRRSKDIAPVRVMDIPARVRQILVQANPPNYPKGLFIASSQQDYVDFIAACLQQGGLRGEEFQKQMALMKHWLAKYKIQSALRLIIYYRNQPFGLIFVHQCDKQRIWTEAEVKLLQHIGTNIGVAFYQTELYRQEQKAKEEAEFANARKNQFLGTISHELRTPLHGILGFSQMLEQEIAGTLNDKQQKYVRNIVHSGQHLLELVDDLLDLTKMETGKLELHPESIIIRPFIEALKTTMNPMAETRKIQILLEVDPNITTVYADPSRLRQILLNLMSNAIKFNKDGGKVIVRVQPALKEKHEPPMVMLQVEDTGIGISSENIKRLFKTFSQLDGSLARKQEGVGLGLALTKYLVELHGGSIGVESEEGQGSLFMVKLPIRID